MYNLPAGGSGGEVTFYSYLTSGRRLTVAYTNMDLNSTIV